MPALSLSFHDFSNYNFPGNMPSFYTIFGQHWGHYQCLRWWEREELQTVWNFLVLPDVLRLHSHDPYCVFLFSSHKSSGWHIENAHGHIWVFLLPMQGNFLPSAVVLSQIKNDHWRKHSLSGHSAASYSWQVTKASQMAYHVSERCSDTKWWRTHMDL